MRWRMCPKCGVKMFHGVESEDVDIYTCPVCKDSQLVITGELLEDVEKLAEKTNRTAEEALLDMIKKLEQYAEDL